LSRGPSLPLDIDLPLIALVGGIAKPFASPACMPWLPRNKPYFEMPKNAKNPLLLHTTVEHAA
jgi:hypothetical protein